MVLKTMKNLSWQEFKKVFPEISTNEIEAEAREMGQDADFNNCRIPAGLYSKTSLAVHLACCSGGPIQYQGMYMDAKTLELVIDHEPDQDQEQAERLTEFHKRMDLLSDMARIRDMFNSLADSLGDLENKLRGAQAKPCQRIRI
jgi:hypothetical protein